MPYFALNRWSNGRYHIPHVFAQESKWRARALGQAVASSNPGDTFVEVIEATGLHAADAIARERTAAEPQVMIKARSQRIRLLR